jgi:hypothetical protein
MIKNKTKTTLDTFFLTWKNGFLLLFEVIFYKFEIYSKIIFQIINKSNVKFPIVYANIRV